VEITEILSHQQAGYAAIIATSICITTFTFIANRAFTFFVNMATKQRRIENYLAKKCEYEIKD